MRNFTSPPPIPNPDVEHLRLLAIFHYIIAALIALASCFPLVYVLFGSFFVAVSASAPAQESLPPALFGLFFILIGGMATLFGWAVALCVFLSGRFLARQRNRVFSIVIAAVFCMFMPLGTLLGVFTIIALNKDSVQRLYDRPA